MLVLCLTIVWIVVFLILDYFFAFIPTCLVYSLIAGLVLGAATSFASLLRNKNPKSQERLENFLPALFLSAILGLCASKLLVVTIVVIRFFFDLFY